VDGSVELGTIWLVDLVGSTRLETSFGPARADQLREEYFALLREAIDRSDGKEFKNTGDGLMVAFASASAAVACAVHAQQLFERRYRGQEQLLHIRIGLGTGESLVKDGDHFGLPAIEAARLCDQAPVDGILISPLTKALAGRVDGAQLESVGLLELKGIPEPMEAFAVRWEPLDRERVLFEREDEAATLEGLLDAVVAGDGRLAMVVGVPGIGKSALLAEMRERAAVRGVAVLTARASELDRAFAFGIVRQLFEQRLYDASARERELLLKGAARHSLAVLGDEVDDEPEGEPAARALHGLYWLAVNIAAQGPLVLCIDDLHWADRASVRWLLHCARRLEALRVFLVITTRPAEPGADQELIDAIAAEADVVIEPSALSARGAEAVISAELGSEPDVAFVDACLRASGGNPLLVRGLSRQLQREGVAPTAMAAGRVEQIGGQGVERAVRARVRALGPVAGEVARAVAVLGDGTTVPAVAQLTGVADEGVRAAAVDLAAIDVLTPSLDLGFVHPLVRSAIYLAIPPVDRARLHREAVAVLGARGADPERLARHLLLVEPRGDGRVAETLLAAGQTAARRGAPDVAVSYLERALAEPPGDSELVDVLVELGTAGALARDPEYERHLEAAMAATPDAERAVEIALLLANSQMACGQWPRSLVVLERAYERLPDGSRLTDVLEGVILGTLDALAPLWTARWEAVAERWVQRWEAGESLEPELVCFVVAYMGKYCPPLSRSARALSEAVAGLDRLAADGRVPGWAIAGTAFSLADHGRLADGGAILDAAITRSREAGATLARFWTVGMRAEISYRQGRLLDAEGEVRETLELVTDDRVLDSFGPGAIAWLMGTAALTLTERGDLDAASELVERTPPVTWDDGWVLVGVARIGRAVVRQARGELDAAIDDLVEVGEVVGERFRNPIAIRWRAPLALMLAARGDRDRALALAREDLERAELFEGPVAIGVAKVACGVATGGEDGVALLREAVSVLAGTEARLEHARALVELGALLRRSGARAEAREPLGEALDRATRCGAVRTAARAREELVASGARPRRDRAALRGPEALTAGERRVAKLAAAGLTNREIAEQLFVTQSAVQWHLRGCFRKLGIASRSDLSTALEPPPAAKDYGVVLSDPLSGSA
jgi:class 3 adenylate cyclase/DNA-binding CsgD family transcriptional regulator